MFVNRNRAYERSMDKHDELSRKALEKCNYFSVEYHSEVIRSQFEKKRILTKGERLSIAKAISSRMGR